MRNAAAEPAKVRDGRGFGLRLGLRFKIRTLTPTFVLGLGLDLGLGFKVRTQTQFSTRIRGRASPDPNLHDLIVLYRAFWAFRQFYTCVLGSPHFLDYTNTMVTAETATA